jgi:hypothetical protein
MRVLLVLSFVVGLSGPVAAFEEADRAAVQSAIGQQLNAFLSDDGATAYSFAAPNITGSFPSAEIFMEMVRQGYKPVYRSMSHEFGALEETPGGALRQTVDIVDADGEFWTAVYTFERQHDGAWKITGCYLLKKPGEVA